MPWNHLNHLKSPFWWLNPKRLMFQCLNPTFSLVNLGLPGFIHGSVRLFRRHRVLEQLEQWRDPQGRKWDFWDEPHGRAIHFIFFCFTVQMWKVKTKMAWRAKLLEALVMRCHAMSCDSPVVLAWPGNQMKPLVLPRPKDSFRSSTTANLNAARLN